MIEFLTGVPGSGKTYKAVFTLFCNFSNDDLKIKIKNDYVFQGLKNAYTNINQLDLNKFHNVYELEFDKLYEKLIILHSAYIKKNSDTQLKELASSLNLLHSLFIIDECHNYFDRKDKVLIWWLSYHRHLYHEIILITQNLSLVESKYKSFSEFFYKAVPSSLKLFKCMKYNQYVNSRLSLNSKTSTLKLPIIKEIFEVYQSGKNHKSKSMILKFLIIAFVLVFFMLAILYFFGFSSSENLPKEENIKVTEKLQNVPNPFTQINNIQNKKNNPFLDDKKEFKKLIKIMCTNKYKICSYNGISFSKDMIDNLSILENYKVLSVSSIPNSDFKNYFILVNDLFIDFFIEKKVVKDDKKNINFLPIVK